VRSRALAAEGLRQMSTAERPDDYLAAQTRWKCAQEASTERQRQVMQKADEAISVSKRKRAESPESRLSDADEEEDKAMAEVAQLVGATDVNALVAIGHEGLEPQARRSGGAGQERPSASRAAAPPNSVQTLLQQLRVEPREEAECTAKFLLYEGYAGEVEEMRSTLFKFYEESRETVPQAIQSDMDKQVKGIDSAEAMGIHDDAKEWFVFHMMRQAEKNNLRMASILDSFEKKLQFLATNDQSECPICLDNFEESGEHAPETLSCCHKVCKDCWKNWSSVMRGRPFCPLCRHDAFLGALAERM